MATDSDDGDRFGPLLLQVFQLGLQFQSEQHQPLRREVLDSSPGIAHGTAPSLRVSILSTSSSDISSMSSSEFRCSLEGGPFRFSVMPNKRACTYVLISSIAG